MKIRRENKKEKVKSLAENPLLLVLVICIILRILVFTYQDPFNNDNHFEYVKYIFDNHKLPLAGQFEQAQHPPFYYLIASLFLNLGGAEVVQSFSLILSIGTIILIYDLLKKLDFISQKNKTYLLLLAGTLPQFILFGNYISNDSLSMFIGVLFFSQLWSYIKKPIFYNQNILAVILGLGLLTKATFILILPVAIISICILNKRNNLPLKKIVFFIISFLAIAILIGGYKYSQNISIYGRPFANALDIGTAGWARGQSNSYQGITSFADPNVLELVKNPFYYSVTGHSYPLMLYGSFWYQYIPDSNLIKNKGSVVSYFGGMIYILAIIPTILMIIGSIKIFYNSKNIINKKFKKEQFEETLFKTLSLFIFIPMLLFSFYGWFKYDVWSFFQARYTFPSMFAILLLLNEGLEYIRNQFLKNIVYTMLLVLYGIFALLFIIAIFNIIH